MYSELDQYYTSEYEKHLEQNGVDTVCFMGYGYSFEEVKVGSEFYISYLFYGRNSTIRHDNRKEEVLKDVLSLQRFDFKNIELTDKFKLVQKFTVKNVNSLDFINRIITPIKKRFECVKIQNLRTNEVIILDDEWVDSFRLFLFDTID